MRRISSRVTFVYKRIFPAVWFGFVVFFAGAPIVLSLLAHQSPSASFIIPPVIMLVIGYFFMRKFVFDLLDGVWDDGDALVVRNGRREDRVPLSDVKNVSYVPMMSPPRVTLSLRKPSLFGDNITFCAPARLLPFSPSPIVSELIERVDAQRRKA